MHFKPQQLVVDIVTIYLNLAKDDENDVFCKAVGEDDRSYSISLFHEAERVLRYNYILAHDDYVVAITTHH